MRQARLRITVWQNGRQLGSADLGTVDNLPAASFTPALASSPTKVDFAGQMGLVDFGVRLEGQSRGLRADAAEKVLLAAQPGDKVRVDLWWRALSAFQDDYTVFIHLYDQKGELLAQHDNQPGNRYRPTSLWQKGDIVEDSQWLTIPPVDNPGIYRLEIGSYLLKTLDRLVVTGSAKTTAFLGLMKISPPPATLTPSNRLDATYGESIVLRGYDLAMEKPVVNPAGEGKLTLDLFWRAGGGVVADYKVFVHLLDGAGKLVAQQDGEPLDGNYPTSFWTKGDELVDHHEIRLAGNDLAKVQQVLVGLYDSVTGQRLATTSGSDFITIK